MYQSKKEKNQPRFLCNYIFSKTVKVMKLTRSAFLKTKMPRALQPSQNRYKALFFFFFKLSQKQPASCFSLPHFLALVSDVTCQPRLPPPSLSTVCSGTKRRWQRNLSLKRKCTVLWNNLENCHRERILSRRMPVTHTHAHT